jgi:fused signal recognition particle receptor
MVFGLFRRKEKTQAALARTRTGWGGGIASLFRGATLADDALWEDVEEALMSADVGVETTLKLVEDVRKRVREENVTGRDEVVELFKEEMAALLEQTDDSVWRWYEGDDLPVKPFVLLIVGVNGVGKTTSIAKLAAHYQRMGKRVVIAAGDTFRAAAIEQLKIWAERVGADLVAHQHGSDPGAVAYDAYEAAVARDADLLIVDTAGRLHTKSNLMDELKKVQRVLKRQNETSPHQTLLVLDATTGHNGLIQAAAFKKDVAVDGVFLTKLDGTAKGGIVVAIAKELGLPVVFLGTGEELDDLSLFNTDDFVDALFSDGAA